MRRIAPSPSPSPRGQGEVPLARFFGTASSSRPSQACQGASRADVLSPKGRPGAPHPFGGVTTSTGTVPTARFPGQWFQVESGLH